MKQIFLTLDYELFGNGQGDVFKHMIEPTEVLLDIAEIFKAKITIFFEVVEFWQLKKELEKGNSMGYSKNPILAIENQLKDAVKRGHDIQLHIHPQWVDAEWKGGHWNVNISEWKLGTYSRNGENSLVNLLRKGKKTIEEIIKPIKQEYECIGIRAGGYNAQPSGMLVNAMREVGLHIDSSVYPGGHENGLLSVYDYSEVPVNLGFWNVNDILEKPVGSQTDIWEMPIMSMNIVRWRKYAYTDRIKSILNNTKGAKESYEAKITGAGAHRKSKLEKIKYLFEDECQTWDYCLLSPSVHRSFIKMIESMKERKHFVLVGHPKSYVGNTGMKYLLKNLVKGGYIFTTISSFYNEQNTIK